MTSVEYGSLRGAISSFLQTEIQTRPQFQAQYHEYLSDFAQRWLDAGYPDQIGRVATNWIKAYLVSVEDRSTAQIVLDNLFFWAQRERLIAINPMEHLRAGVPL